MGAIEGQDVVNSQKTSAVYLYSGTIDPSVVAVRAVTGTLYLGTSTAPGGNGGKLWQKQNNGLNTDWTLVGADLPPPPPFGPIVETAIDYPATGAVSVLVDTSAGVRVVSAPDPATIVGQVIMVKKVSMDANPVTFTPSTGTVDDAASFSLTTYNQAQQFLATLAGYKIIA